MNLSLALPGLLSLFFNSFTVFDTVSAMGKQLVLCRGKYNFLDVKTLRMQ